MNINATLAMEVNATLIVQAINFFIAYLLFRFILLKPGYAAICRDEEMKASMVQLIIDDRQRIDGRRQEWANQWKASYVYFKKHIPEPLNIAVLFKKAVPKIELMSIDESSLKAIKTRVVQSVVIAAQGGVYDARH